ncbi:hypothetical protein K449DRAFT_468174 [Hypoxylon sp. EC38]|nr:hypothetical protein K449DRAFT_468174 [Hypoxylon sp. EC38]
MGSRTLRVHAPRTLIIPYSPFDCGEEVTWVDKMEQAPRVFLSVKGAFFSLLRSFSPVAALLTFDSTQIHLEQNLIMAQPIIMKSTNHPGTKDIYAMPGLMGSVGSVSTNSTISTEANFEHEGSNDDDNTDQPCAFQKGVVDNCYKSRFYARMFEFYFVDNNPELFKVCRCPMENCPQRNFTHPKQMLLHLKNCKFFSQGLFRCPTCNDAEKFETTSNRKCSWNKEKFSQKVQRVVKAGLKSITIPRSGSKLPLEHCKECGRSLRMKAPWDPLQLPEIPSRPCSTSPIFDASSFTIPVELPNSTPPQELIDTSLPPELTGDSSTKGHKEAPPSSICYDEAHHIISSVSDVSLSSDLPSVRTLSSASTSGIDSAGLSPAITPESFTSTSTGYAPTQMLPPNHYGRIDYVSDIQTSVSGIGYVEQPQNRLQRPRSTLIYNAPSTFDSVTSQSSFGQRGSPGGRGYALSLRTPSPNLNCIPWTPYQETVNLMNCVGQLQLRNSPVSPSLIEESPLIDFTPRLDSFATVNDADAAEPFVPFTNSSPMDSLFPSASSDMPPNSESFMSEFQCPKCEYHPAGKPKGFRAALRKHMDVHKEARHKCPHCTRTYKRADNRKAHVDKKHNSPGVLKKRQRSSDSLGPRRKKSKKASRGDVDQEIYELSA